MSTPRPLTPHIQRMPENPSGHDKVIGDVHGNKEKLEQVLKQLGENDRLFIVGDLVDKGQNSLGVLELLQRPEYKDKVFAVRGNHEQMCLDSIHALETLVNWIFAVKGQVADPAAALKEALKQILTSVGLQHGPLEERQVKKVAEAFLGRAPIDTDEPLLQAIQKLRLHKHNKGSWLTKAFIDDLRNQKITIRPATDDSSQWALARKKDSAIRQIDRYMSDLPVIRLVSGRKPFIVVHADMPLSDQELLSRAQEGEDLNLTESQFKRAIWWRAEDKEQPDPVREASSILVITGHSIIRSAPNKAVRQDRNTVNLDVAAHAMNTFLVLNVTTREAKFSNPDQLQKLDTKDQGRLEEVAARINSQMQAVKRQHKSLIDDKNGLRYQQRSWASRLFYYKPKVRKPELKPAGQGPLASTEKPAEKGEPRSRRNLVALDPARQEEKASSGPFAGLRQFFKPKGPGAAN